MGSGFQNMSFVTATRVKIAADEDDDGASASSNEEAASSNETASSNEKAASSNHRFAGLSSFIRPQYGGDVHATTVDGIYPYVSNRSDVLGEMMFYFHHAKLKRTVLVTAPVGEREAAISFLREHSTLHPFDKFCSVCGKTGGLLKCPCKRVRNCGAECQRAD
jgi:hypothetical protein